MLSVEEYEKLESAAVAELPNRLVETVGALPGSGGWITNQTYPIRVRSLSELWKYLDTMHETRFERDFAGLFGGKITKAEFALLQQVARIGLDYSRKQFGRSLTIRASLLRALQIYQQLADIFGGKPASVFEIGPGSGALGCLFLLNRWAYAATEIAQAFYLQQNQLWNHATGGMVRAGGTLAPGQAVHFPWWEFYRFIERGIPSVDLVTCNHALAEMHPNSRAFIARVAHQMLRGEGTKVFAFEGWGCENAVSRAAITEQFQQGGFSLVHNDTQITVFVPSGRPPATTKPNPSRQFVRALACSLELDVSLLAIRKKMGHPRGYARLLAARFLGKTELSQRIRAGRKQRKLEATVGLAEVNKFYADLLQSQDLNTPDERFLTMIGCAY